MHMHTHDHADNSSLFFDDVESLAISIFPTYDSHREASAATVNVEAFDPVYQLTAGTELR